MCYAGPDGPPAPTIKTKEEFLFHLSRLSTSGKLEGATGSSGRSCRAEYLPDVPCVNSLF